VDCSIAELEVIVADIYDEAAATLDDAILPIAADIEDMDAMDAMEDIGDIGIEVVELIILDSDIAIDDMVVDIALVGLAVACIAQIWLVMFVTSKASFAEQACSKHGAAEAVMAFRSDPH